MHLIVKFIPEPNPAIMGNLGTDVSIVYNYSSIEINVFNTKC